MIQWGLFLKFSSKCGLEANQKNTMTLELLLWEFKTNQCSLMGLSMRVWMKNQDITEGKVVLMTALSQHMITCFN